MYSLQNQMNSQEEQIIYNLVDDIYQAEAKISEINQTLPDSFNNPSNEDIENNLQKEKELAQKLTEIESEATKNINQAESIIEQKHNSIKEIDKEITELKSNLNQYNPLTFKSALLSKYILTRTQNDFLTSEQLEEILNGLNCNDDNTIELQKTKVDIEHNKNTQILLKNQIEEGKSKINENENLLQMMKEEKISVKEELINLISQKESLEEIVKLSIINMSSSNVNGKRSYPINNQEQKDLELYSYEINHIDLNKTTNAICDGIMEIVESSNNINNNQVIMELNIGEVRNGSPPPDDNNNSHNNIIQRDYLMKIIKDEMGNFQKSIKAYVASPVNNFINSLANIILNSILSYDSSQRDSNRNNMFGDINLSNFNTNISAQSLSYFLICTFKVFYYESLIENKIALTTKEYKLVKKERIKQGEQMNLNLTKLYTKLEDAESKSTELDNKLKILVEQSEKNKATNMNSLTQNEKSYIELSSKGNLLIKQKNELENEIKKLKEQISSIENEKIKEINQVNDEINNTKEKINSIKSEIEAKKLKANEEIIMLRQQIADKFNIIKTQLQIYKSKHGSNLTIYNKLIDSINTTIKSTYTKKPYFPRNGENISSNPSNILSKNLFYEHSVFLSEKKKHRNRSLMNNTNNSENEEHFEENSIAKRATSNTRPQYQINKINVNIDKSTASKQSKNSSNITVQTNNFNINGHHRTNSALAQSSSIKTPQKKDISPIHNNNNSTNLWLEEKEKLAKTIQNLKETISNLNNNSISNNNISYRNNNSNTTLINTKIAPLTQITFCYYRINSSSIQKFNPLVNSTVNSFTSPPLSFIKGTLCLNKHCTIIHISPSVSLNSPIEIPIDSIDNTIVNSTIKKIIEIHREYRKIRNNKQIDIDQFAEKEEFKSFQMSKHEIIKSAVNKYFNFSLLINKSKRVEFIMGSYSDFKTWINGIAFLIKNRHEGAINKKR